MCQKEEGFNRQTLLLRHRGGGEVRDILITKREIWLILDCTRVKLSLFLCRHGVITLQALSEANRRLWMEAMDGKEPV